MISSQLSVTLAGALILSSVPASAQDQSTLVPIAGVWSLGETRSCDSGPAWVFFADGPAAVGIWRDEGDAIAYTHAHMPFEGHERPMRVRHLTIEERTAEKLTTRNYRGVTRTFHRCPANSLKVPAGQDAH